MKKDIAKTIVTLIVCLIGGVLIGFNAGKLSNTVNVVLFVVGVFLVSASTTIVGLLKTIFKDKEEK